MTELELTAQERTEVKAIQNTEDLTTYFAKLPRDYDVQIIVSDGIPDCKFPCSIVINIFFFAPFRVEFRTYGQFLVYSS